MKWFIMLALLMAGIVYVAVTRINLNPKMEEKSVAIAPPPPPPASAQPIEERLNAATVAQIRQMEKDSNPRVRMAALDMLYKFNDPQALAMIQQILQNEQDTEVIKSSLAMLTRNKNKDALPILLKAMTHYEADVRVAAINDIAQFGDENTIPQLTVAMKDMDDGVKIAAVQAVASVQKQVEDRRRKEEEERRKKEAEEAAKKKG